MLAWASAAFGAGCAYVGAGALAFAGGGSSGGGGRKLGPPDDVQVPPPTRLRDPIVCLVVTVAARTEEVLVQVVIKDGAGEDLDVRDATLVSAAILNGGAALTVSGNRVTGIVATVDTDIAICWDSAQDLDYSAGEHIGVCLRFTPFGRGKQGRSTDFGPVTVGDTPPVVAFVEPDPGDRLEGNIAILLDVRDAEGDVVELAFDFLSANKGSGDMTLIFADNPLEGVVASPEGSELTIVWDSDGRGDLEGELAFDVKLTVTPDDGNENTAEQPVMVTIVVDNNSSPSVAPRDLGQDRDRVRGTVLEVAVTDLQLDVVDLVFQWREVGLPFPDLVIPDRPDFDVHDPMDRRRLLIDPDFREERRRLHILTERLVPIEGTAEAASIPLGADEIQVSALLLTTFLAPRPQPGEGPGPGPGPGEEPGRLVGRGIEILRDATPSALASGDLTGAVAVEPGGATALVGRADGALVRVDLAGDLAPEVVATGLGTLSAIAIERGGEHVLVTDRAGGRLHRIERASGLPAAGFPLLGFDGPEGVAVVSRTRALVTDDTGAGGDLYEVNLATGDRVRILQGLEGPRGIVATREGSTVYIAEAEAATPRILELDVLRRTPTLVIPVAVPEPPPAPAVPAAPAALAFRPDGDRRSLLIATGEGAASHILEMDLGTFAMGILAPEVDAPGGVDAARDGTILFTEAGGDLLVRDGVAARRTIADATLVPPRLILDADLVPPAVPGRTRFRIPRGRTEGVLGLASSPVGARHAFVWDTLEDDLPQRPILVGVTPFDDERGIRTEARGAKTFAELEPGPALSVDPLSIRDAAIGDIAGDDGALDIVAAVRHPTPFLTNSFGHIRSFPQDPLSTFPASANAVVNSLPEALAVGDVDGDGDLDTVSANTQRIAFGSPDPTSFHNVTIVFQAGGALDGSSELELATDGAPLDVAVADLEGDGDLDIVATTALIAAGDEHKVQIFTQTFPGVFDGTQLLLLGTATVPRHVALGDMDQDGDVDIVTANRLTNDVTVFPQRLPGLFDSTPSATLRRGSSLVPSAIALGDLEGDGDLDVFEAFDDPGGSGFVVFVQQDGAPGTFAFHLTRLTGPRGLGGGLAVRDLDDDGDLDVVAGETANDSSSLLVFYADTPDQPGAIEALPSVRFQNTRPIGIAVGNIDREGDLDIVATHVPDPDFPNEFRTLRAFRAMDPAAFLLLPPAAEVDPEIFLTVESMKLGDLDGDGDLDGIFRDGFLPHIGLLRNPAPGVIERADPLNAGLSLRDAALGDVDGDGDLDIVGGGDRLPEMGGAGGELVLLRQGGDGIFDEHRVAIVTGRSPTRLALGDIDGDGDLDIVAADQELDQVFIVRQTGPGGQFEAAPGVVLSDPSVQGIAAIALGDIDGDGDLDIGAATAGSASIAFFRQEGGGPGDFEAAPDPAFVLTAPEATRFISFALGDLEPDGDLDVVGVDDGFFDPSEDVVIFLQAESGGFEATVLGGMLSAGVTLGDLEGDGDLDLAVVSAPASGADVPRLSLVRQAAPGVFETAPFARLPYHFQSEDLLPFAVGLSSAVGDLEGDGEVEVLTGGTAIRLYSTSVR